MRALPLVVLISLMSACTTFPELDDTIGPQVADLPYPTLEPQEEVIFTADDSEIEEEETRAEIAERTADLNARAATLRDFEFEFP